MRPALSIGKRLSGRAWFALRSAWSALLQEPGGEDPAARERDLALLLERCKNDVRATRAAYSSPRLRPLQPEERRSLLLDAEINARGICGNVPFLEAARTLATQERNAINTRLNELTAGVITSIDQVARIMTAVNAHGQGMTSLNKRSVATTLAHQPDGFVRELLELRQRGAFASTRKFKKLLDFANPTTTESEARCASTVPVQEGGPRSERSCTTCRATTASCRPR